MATTIEKLNIIKKVKQDIKAAIQKKGIEVGNIPFSQYANKIDQIPEIKAGYVQVANNVMTVHNITDNTTSAVNKLYITDTKVSAPNYTEARLTKQLTFYQCDSIDTTNKTWTGYKWILLSSVYVKQDTLTTDLLTYSNIIPQIGKIYTSDALVRMSQIYEGFPTQGLIFYASFKESQDTAQTGQALTPESTGTLSYTTYKGLPCLYTQYNGYSAALGTDLNISTDDFTVCFWACQTLGSKESGTNYRIVSSSDNSIYDSSIMNNYSSQIYVSHYPGLGNINCPSNKTVRDTWYFITIIHTKTSLKIYQNNVLLKENYFTQQSSATVNTVKVPGNSINTYPGFVGYMAGFRIFNRALTLFQMETLFNEYQSE